MATSGKTTFMVISDTHNIELDNLGPCPLSHPMPKVDVLLHCGDLTVVGGLSAYKKALQLLGSFDAELKLVIAGNHDISLDRKHWENSLDKGDDPNEHEQAFEIMTGPPAKAAGVTYLAEGVHSFTLRSGKSFSIYACPYQPEFDDWAFAYERTEDRFNLEPAPGLTSIAQHPIPDDVDIVMTHGPPREILDFVPGGDEHQGHVGCDALLHAMQRVRPLMHCFGHIHESRGVGVKLWETGRSLRALSQKVTIDEAGTGEPRRSFDLKRGHGTLMVNAAIMDGRYRPSHAPWVVELELPLKS